jgi:hypothetical protein
VGAQRIHPSIIQEQSMKLFGQAVRTLVNVAALPVAVVKDVYTLGGTASEQNQTYTQQQLQKIATEAEEE